MSCGELSIVLGFCLVFCSYGEGNEKHTELQRAKLVPDPMTEPGATHQDEAAVFGLELKYPNSCIKLMKYRARLRRHAEKKKKKHKAGAFSPLSVMVVQEQSNSLSVNLSVLKIVFDYSCASSLFFSFFFYMSLPKMSQDEKKIHNSRTKRHGSSKGKNTKLVKQLLNHYRSHHDQTSPREKRKVSKKKQVKKSHPPGVFSVLSYTAQDKERSHGQTEDLDD